MEGKCIQCGIETHYRMDGKCLDCYVATGDAPPAPDRTHEPNTIPVRSEGNAAKSEAVGRAKETLETVKDSLTTETAADDIWSRIREIAGAPWLGHELCSYCRMPKKIGEPCECADEQIDILHNDLAQQADELRQLRAENTKLKQDIRDWERAWRKKHSMFLAQCRKVRQLEQQISGDRS